MNINNNQEFEALCARLLPKFNEYLLRHSKNIFSCELVSSLDGVTSMPALYSKDGVQKQVIAPISLLSRDVDEVIAKTKEAMQRANDSAKLADDAASSVTKATAGLTEERQKVSTAISQAETAATNADTAAQKAYDKIEEMNHFALDIATGAIAPSRMNIEVLHDISTHNSVAQKIAVNLLPSYLPQSVLFQRAEGSSLVADPSGNLYVKGEGTTKFWVIPTANTPLWQEVSITVRQPRMRLSASGKLRLSANGKIRIV